MNKADDIYYSVSGNHAFEGGADEVWDHYP